MPFAEEPDNIWRAAREGRLTDVQAFLSDGSPIDVRDKGRGTPLHSAVEYGQLRVAKWLLERNANINAKTLSVPGERHGTTPLHEAILTGQSIEMIRLLLAHRPNLDVRMSDGSTALHLAAETGNMDLIKLLVDHGACITICDQMRHTPFTTALVGSHLEVARYLASCGSDIHHRTEPFSKTPLILAAFNLQVEQVDFLLTAGADVHARDDKGQTALHHAVIGTTPYKKTEWKQGKVLMTENQPADAVPIVKRLLEAGIDPTIKDDDGWTALKWARKGRMNDLIELLERCQHENG